MGYNKSTYNDIVCRRVMEFSLFIFRVFVFLPLFCSVIMILLSFFNFVFFLSQVNMILPLANSQNMSRYAKTRRKIQMICE
jgi:hypothetical protein